MSVMAKISGRDIALDDHGRETQPDYFAAGIQVAPKQHAVRGDRRHLGGE